MSELTASLRVVAAVLGAWAVVSALAALPIAWWLRGQALANLALDRDGRREAWPEAASEAGSSASVARW